MPTLETVPSAFRVGQSDKSCMDRSPRSEWHLSSHQRDKVAEMLTAKQGEGLRASWRVPGSGREASGLLLSTVCMESVSEKRQDGSRAPGSPALVLCSFSKPHSQLDKIHIMENSFQSM